MTLHTDHKCNVNFDLLIWYTNPFLYSRINTIRYYVCICYSFTHSHIMHTKYKLKSLLIDNITQVINYYRAEITRKQIRH